MPFFIILAIVIAFLAFGLTTPKSIEFYVHGIWSGYLLAGSVVVSAIFQGTLKSDALKRKIEKSKSILLSQLFWPTCEGSWFIKLAYFGVSLLIACSFQWLSEFILGSFYWGIIPILFGLFITNVHISKKIEESADLHEQKNLSHTCSQQEK